MTGLRGRIICGTAQIAPPFSNFLSFKGRLVPFIFDHARPPLDRSIVGPQFGSLVLDQNAQWEPYMKRLFLASAIFLTLAPAMALAQGRGGDAALGALSGAVVLGPVGAVAGAVVGYTAGPSIAHSWGFGRSGSRKPSRAKSQAGLSPRRVTQNVPAAAASPEQSGTVATSAPSGPAPSSARQGAAPPVQSLE
jgi:hypothetical protein